MYIIIPIYAWPKGWRTLTIFFVQPIFWQRTVGSGGINVTKTWYSAWSTELGSPSVSCQLTCGKYHRCQIYHLVGAMAFFYSKALCVKSESTAVCQAKFQYLYIIHFSTESSAKNKVNEYLGSINKNNLSSTYKLTLVFIFHFIWLNLMECCLKVSPFFNVQPHNQLPSSFLCQRESWLGVFFLVKYPCCGQLHILFTQTIPIGFFEQATDMFGKVRYYIELGNRDFYQRTIQIHFRKRRNTYIWAWLEDKLHCSRQFIFLVALDYLPKVLSNCLNKEINSIEINGFLEVGA